MSTAPQEDWRAQAMRNMQDMDEAPIPERKPQDGWAGLMLAKLGLLILLTIPLIWLGYGWLFAVGLVAWYIFWPR